MSHNQSVYETLARILVEEDVSKVFTLMSDATMGIVSTLDGEHGTEDIEVIHTRHEQAAVSMADGYNRLTGELGVGIVGKGPALANTGNALVGARKKGSNVLLIVPDEPLSRYYDNPAKRFGQEAYLNATIGGAASDRNRYGNTSSVINIRSTDTLRGDFKEAIRRLRTGEGPIAVQIPADILNGELEQEYDWDQYVPTSEAAYRPPRLQPDDEQINEGVDRYLDSDETVAPVIIAGAGAVSSSAKTSIEQLAERMNAFMVTTMQSRGLFSTHPYGLGFIGGKGRSLANEQVLESDFVLALGCSLNQFTTDENHLLGAEDDPTTIVHVDTNPSSIGRYTPVDLGVVGDAKLAAEAFHTKLQELNVDREGSFWTEEIVQRNTQHPDFMNPDQFEKHEEYIDPREIILGMNNAMSEDRAIVVESGHAKFWVLNGIDIPNAGDFFWTLDFSSIGQAVPIGIGAASGSSDRTVFSFCGDAGFMMSLQEVETAVRHDIPIVITVINDSALGSEYHELVMEEEYADSAVIEAPDVGEVASTLGAEGYTVRNTADVDEVCDRLSDPVDGPIVVNCEVMRDFEVKYSGS